MAQMIHDEDDGKIAYRKMDPDSPVYYNDRINILEDLESIKLGEWEVLKNRMREIFLGNEDSDLFFIAHKEDEIVGKPQRLSEVKQKVVLLTQARKHLLHLGENVYKDKYIFLDENYDKRYDGGEHKILGFHFWLYRVVENGIEYMVLSEKKLDSQQHRLKGMKIDLKDSSELTKTLKLKTISNLFLVVEDRPSIQPMSKKDLVEFVKDLDLTQEEFIDFLYTHPDGKIYSHTKEYSKIRVYQELSGKFEGYPLHLIIWGGAGRGKTLELECIENKFEEEQAIFEAGSSTLKGLIPSFSEKPANPGHILKCLRRCLIDEMNKMFDKTTNYENVKGYLGQLNFLLEHKDREIGSGNNNSFRAHATAKLTIATNGFGYRHFVHEHMDVLDPTTLSRVLNLVVNSDEYNFVKQNRLKKNTCKKISKHQFLSIYDSCQNFLVDYDEEKVREIIQKTLEKAEKMSEIWEARSLHHSILLLDGIVKFRCLFHGDVLFRARKEDYEELEKTLLYVMESWTCAVKT